MVMCSAYMVSLLCLLLNHIIFTPSFNLSNRKPIQCDLGSWSGRFGDRLLFGRRQWSLRLCRLKRTGPGRKPCGRTQVNHPNVSFRYFPSCILTVSSWTARIGHLTPSLKMYRILKSNGQPPVSSGERSSFFVLGSKSNRVENYTEGY